MKVNKKIFTSITLGIIGVAIAACANDKSKVRDQNSGGEKVNEEEELRVAMKEGKEKDVEALSYRLPVELLVKTGVLQWAMLNNNSSVVTALIIGLDFPTELLVKAEVLQWAMQNNFDGVVNALVGREDFPVELLVEAEVLQWAMQNNFDGVVNALVGREDFPVKTITNS